jgi:tyrosyl-tRNA synthetase
VPCSMDDNMRVSSIFSPEKAVFSKFFLVKLGKKKYHLFYRE